MEPGGFACYKCAAPVEPTQPFGREGTGQAVYINVPRERITGKFEGSQVRKWLKVGYLCLRCAQAEIAAAAEAAA